MRNLALILAALAFLTGCGSGDGESGSGEVVIDLEEQNGSGESGTATLTTDGRTSSPTRTRRSPSTAPQPAHIHEGSCKELDPTPAYGLENVVGGKSTTTVDRPLEELRDADYAINVHKSASQLDVYVACGDLRSGDPDSGNGDYGGGY